MIYIKNRSTKLKEPILFLYNKKSISIVIIVYVS